MTQDEIIEMANKAYAIDDGKPLHPSALFHLERFAKLVAQHERDACAEIAFNGCLVPPDGGSPTEAERLMCEDIANAIRARGQA
jgi:hypothetical protein